MCGPISLVPVETAEVLTEATTQETVSELYPTTLNAEPLAGETTLKTLDATTKSEVSTSNFKFFKF